MTCPRTFTGENKDSGSNNSKEKDNVQTTQITVNKNKPKSHKGNSVEFSFAYEEDCINLNLVMNKSKSFGLSESFQRSYHFETLLGNCWRLMAKELRVIKFLGLTI